MRSKSIRHSARFLESVLQPHLAMILGEVEEKHPELSESRGSEVEFSGCLEQALESSKWDAHRMKETLAMSSNKGPP